MSQLKSTDPQSAKTITIGSFITKIMMDKLNFGGLLISPNGFEGVLDYYLYFRLDKNILVEKNYIDLDCESLPAIKNNLNTRISISSSSPSFLFKSDLCLSSGTYHCKS